MRVRERERERRREKEKASERYDRLCLCLCYSRSIEKTRCRIFDNKQKHENSVTGRIPFFSLSGTGNKKGNSFFEYKLAGGIELLRMVPYPFRSCTGAPPTVNNAQTRRPTSSTNPVKRSFGARRYPSIDQYDGRGWWTRPGSWL